MMMSHIVQPRVIERGGGAVTCSARDLLLIIKARTWHQFRKQDEHIMVGVINQEKRWTSSTRIRASQCCLCEKRMEKSHVRKEGDPSNRLMLPV